MIFCLLFMSTVRILLSWLASVWSCLETISLIFLHLNILSSPVMNVKNSLQLLMISLSKWEPNSKERRIYTCLIVNWISFIAPSLLAVRSNLSLVPFTCRTPRSTISSRCALSLVFMMFFFSFSMLTNTTLPSSHPKVICFWLSTKELYFNSSKSHQSSFFFVVNEKTKQIKNKIILWFDLSFLIMNQSIMCSKIFSFYLFVISNTPRVS